MEHKNVFVEIFNELLSEHELNRKQFAEKSNIPYTTVIGWTTLNRLPDYTALIKIADFFHCSIDYLTGRHENYGEEFYSKELSPKEEKLINQYRKLQADDKKLVDALIKKLFK